MHTCQASSPLSLFPAHIFNPDEREETLLNNILIDWYSGHKEIVERIQHPKYASYVQHLRTLSSDELDMSLQKAKKKSVLMTSLFLSGKCDANCEICYTDRRLRPSDLNLDQIKQVIVQMKELGSKTLYIPGEGEPFLDKGMFDLIKFAALLDQNVVIFTDGLLISDETRFKQLWGFSLEEFYEMVKRYPVYLYVKYWHSNRNIFSKMMGIPAQQLHTDRLVLENGTAIDVPRGLIRLMEVAPDKVGIETAVHTLNFDNVFESILPFVKQYGLKWYLEPIIHSGRYFGRHEYDLTPEQYQKISPLLTKQQCKRTGFSTVLMATGHVSYCPSFVTNLSVKDPHALKELYVREEGKEQIRDIFSILHSSEFLVRARYAAYTHSCLCDYISKKMEDGAKWSELTTNMMEAPGA